LTGLHPKLIDLSLGRTERLLAALGNPERRIPPVIHVAGTNGKGSVIAFLKAIFEAAGLTAHVYTSPHLVYFHERIAPGGVPISDAALVDILQECEAANDGAPITFFEITTAAAFLAFSRQPADIVLLETGLGGRFDSTNVIETPRLCAITPISIDHVQFLGETIEKIAFEKAGILKPGVDCVVAPQTPEAMRVISDRAAEIGANLYPVADIDDFQMPTPGLVGDHQTGNAKLAYGCIRRLSEFKISDDAVRDGIAAARWPARLQHLTSGNLVDELPAGWELWLDGGHNLSAAQALADFALSRNDRPLHVIAGMLNNRDAVEFLRVLAPHAASIQVVAIPGEENTHDPEQVARAARAAGLDVRAAPGTSDAIVGLSEDAPARVLICGSLYLAGSVLAMAGVDSGDGFLHPSTDT
jgi:dihydrofolate synthase / folylpolyglutamate synthase